MIKTLSQVELPHRIKDIYKNPTATIILNGERLNLCTLIHPYDGILLVNKKDELLIQATIWMDLKSIVLCARRRTQKARNCMFMLG